MNIQQHLQGQIDALNIRANAHPFTMEESEEAYELFFKLMDRITSDNELNEEEKEQFCQANEKMTLITILQEMDNYLTSIDQDLTEIVTRYVITDETMVSPAGFHTTDKVFLTTNVMIQCDKLPRYLSEGLGYYDMTKKPFTE